ncbi:MAG: hypothetical protein LDL39_02850 [Magnetospirillum sp.]|nr:hypothetical protein [Magnetospirillum sp.]
MTFRFERHYADMAGATFASEPYFRSAWRFRGELLSQWIAEGETVLPRLLTRFTTLERRYVVNCGIEDGAMTGLFVYVPKGTVHAPLDALEHWSEGVLRGKTVDMPEYVNYDTISLLADLADGVDTVLELGAGYGLQLFRLFYAGAPADARYVAADISQAGLDLGESLSRLEPRMNFSTVAFDIARPDWSVLKGSRKALIFTHWSMMYAPKVPDDFFGGLAGWPGEAVMVFVEPLGFQWGGGHPVSEKQREAAEMGALNGDFAEALSAAAAKGWIEPLVVANDVFSRSQHPFDLCSVVVCSKPAG